MVVPTYLGNMTLGVPQLAGLRTMPNMNLTHYNNLLMSNVSNMIANQQNSYTPLQPTSPMLPIQAENVNLGRNPGQTESLVDKQEEAQADQNTESSPVTSSSQMSPNIESPITASMIEEANKQYLQELQAEKESLSSLEDTQISKVHILKLLDNEITHIQNGGNKSYESQEQVKYYDIYRERPIRLTVRALVPVKEHPKFNFVGKLLGPKGNSMKRLQEETMTKMAVLGRGSMRDKQKEEELRSSCDPKYQHLQEDLHVEITAFAPPAEAHARIAYSLTEVRKYLIPDSNDDIRQEQMREMEIMSTNGDAMDHINKTSSLVLNNSLSGVRPFPSQLAGSPQCPTFLHHVQPTVAPNNGAINVDPFMTAAFQQPLSGGRLEQPDSTLSPDTGAPKSRSNLMSTVDPTLSWTNSKSPSSFKASKPHLYNTPYSKSI